MKAITFVLHVDVLFVLFLLVDVTNGFVLVQKIGGPLPRGSNDDNNYCRHHCQIESNNCWKRIHYSCKAKHNADDDVVDQSTDITLLNNPSRVIKREGEVKSADPHSGKNTSSKPNQRPRVQSRGHAQSGGHRNHASSRSSDANRKLNQALVQAESATAVLQLLQQHAKLPQVAAGRTLNSVNFSTAMHRLARHAVTATTSHYPQERAFILADPRTALLLASLAETLAEDPQFFQSRELSNIGWALAKLKLPPPSTAMPVLVGDGDFSTVDSLMQESRKNLAKSAATVRTAVMQVAAERVAAQQQQQQGNDAAAFTTDTAANRWIPALSQLAGHVLDAIGATVLLASSQSMPKQQQFELQEWSNLLWAWATAGRVDERVFGHVVRSMIHQQTQKLRRENNNTSSSVQSSNTENAADVSPLRPQEWSNSVWAFATALCYDSHIDLLEYVAALLDDRSNFIDTFKSQELSNTAWGVATLLSNNKKQQPQQPSDDNNDTSTTAAPATTMVTDREQRAALTILRHVFASVVRRKAEGFRTQELSNTVWAAATLGFGLSQAQSHAALNNNYVILESDQPAADTQLMVDTVNVIVNSALTLLPRFWSQELNNVAWALARLLSDSSHSNLVAARTDSFRTNVRRLLQGIGTQLADPRRSVTSQDIGTTLWALATLEFFDEQIYRGIATRLAFSRAHLYKPQELSNSIWALATAEIAVGSDIDVFDITMVPASQRPTKPQDPLTMCFGIAAQVLMQRPHQFKSQEIKDVLWSFSKVGIRHPALFKSVAEHLVGSEDGVTDARSLDEFSPQGLGNTAWAYARQAQLSENVIDRLNLNGGNGRLVVYKTIYFDIGEELLQKLFGSIAETNLRVHDELRKGKPQDISNTAWAFAALGLKHTKYMEAAKDALADRSERYVRGERNSMTTFKAQELANLLWALATLNVSPGNILDVLMPYLRESCEDSTGKFTAASISKQFKRQELANMAWACAVFGDYPEELMHFLYTGLLGLPGKEQNPSYMQNIHNDFGLQMQAIMTLIYVQAEMDIRGCCQSLSLPDSFPDGWKQSQTAQASYDDHMTEISLELNLSTSKVQRAVSAAFSRIGFDHVEEHTIAMEEMANEYGVRVSSNQMEILSIDIANVKEKIGIEVDGPAHFITRIEDRSDGAPNSAVGGVSKIVNGKLEYQFGWTGEHQEMNGPTCLKERLLNSFGWKVIHLPFWDWYALSGDSSAEERYCRELLDKAA